MYVLSFLQMWVVYLTLPAFDPAYMRIYNGIAKLIEELNPATVVVDSLLNPGIDACYFLKRRFVLNCPNTPMDLARLQQPWLKGLWYYPAFVLLSSLILNLRLSHPSSDQLWQWDTIPGPMEGSPHKHSGQPNTHI